MRTRTLQLAIGGRAVGLAATRSVRRLLRDLPGPPPRSDGGAATIDLRPADPGDAGEALRLLNRVAADPVPDRVAIHGGLVVVDGLALLAPGPSHAGKSTFVTLAATAHGAAYGGDELVHLLIENGRIAPYVKPVSLKPGSWRIVSRHIDDRVGWRDRASWLVPGRSLGGGLVLDPVHPAAVVFPERCGCLTTEVERLTASETALRLSQHATNLQETGPDGFRALCTLARRAPGLVVRFGDASDAVLAARLAVDSEGAR